jgi:hypothetical protein
MPVYGESGQCSVFRVQGEKGEQVKADWAVRVTNRGHSGALAASVHVVSPQDEVVYKADIPLAVAAGTSQVVSVTVPVDASWGLGLYPAYFTAGDPAAGRQFHQAMTWLAVPGSLGLCLTPAQLGWPTGGEAAFTVAVSNAAPWEGVLRFGVYDFRGRLLGAEERAVRLAPGTNAAAFAWRVADHGVRVDTYRAVVSAVREGREWARAEAQFFRYDRWDMRNEYQWSVWAGLACYSPSTVAPAMRLIAHAGMNSLGYPGRGGLHYPAERWGWRYYNEGIGLNTFSPVIECESDAELEAAFRAEAARLGQSPDQVTAAFVLASVGEEAGFKHGWGHTYYWEEPVAPEKACRAFRWFLRTRYASLDKLNATWRTQYGSWDEVKLTREFSGQAPTLAADGWAHPKESPLGGTATGVTLAPYSDTQQFYAWYYDRIIAVAQRLFREKANPVALTMASAPASWIFASRECDVPTAGPSAWNESQTHSLANYPGPSFGLVWGHFDWSAKTEDLLWGFLLQRTGHNDYWFDALMFNGDLTHTRSTLDLRRWTARLAGHEGALLDGRPVAADVGILPPNGLTPSRDFVEMRDSLAVALMQAGLSAEEAKPTELARYRIVFAVGRQAVSAAEAATIATYVDYGGTFVFTDRFANQDEFGGPQAVVPGQGLAKRWGFTVTNAVTAMAQYGQTETTRMVLDGVADALKGQSLAGLNLWRESVKAEGWDVRAAYPKGTPGLMTKALGRGRLVYLNAVYSSHRYIQFRTPTDAPRQGFFRLAEWLCLQAGARQAFRLEGDPSQFLHVAAKQFTDSTGKIRHVILKNSIEAPWVSGRLEWQGYEVAAYDVLTGQLGSTTEPFVFRPNEGRWLAFVDRPVVRVTVEVQPARIVPGEAVRLRVRVLDGSGRDVPGSFPLTLRVTCGDNELQGLGRAFCLQSGQEHALRTALSDMPGSWSVEVTEGLSRKSGRARVQAARKGAGTTGPGFVPWAWPSETAEPQALPSAEFLARLGRLATLYRTDQSGRGWMTKQVLAAHYDYFPDTRHSLMRPLYDEDWTRHADAWRAAIIEGATFVLTGEDLGVEPGSGLETYPHGDSRAFEAVIAALRGAEWRLGTLDGDTLSAKLGRGRMILCRESVDAAGHSNADAAAWQKRWLEELVRPDERPAAGLWDAARLRRWWVGELAALPGRQVTWFGGNTRELTLDLDPDQPLDRVVVLPLPPSGKVSAVDFAATVSGAAATNTVSFDVGCDDTVEAKVRFPVSYAPRTELDWPAAVQRHLDARAAQGDAVRDGNGWRLVPVRLRSATKAKVTLFDPWIVVE